MTRTKFLWALKFTAEKFMPKNLKKKSKITSISSVLILCIIKANLAYSIALTRQNDVIVNKKKKTFAEDEVNVIHRSFLRLQPIILSVSSLRWFRILF